jgi:hypothetical protein
MKTEEKKEDTAGIEIKFDMPQKPVEEPTNLPMITETKTVESESEESTWKLAQRKAMALSKSDLLPQSYRNNISNCLVAMELATRTGMNELMVMQNLHIIQGKPSWSSTFAIAVINSSKRFRTMLNFRIEGSGDDLSCVAWAVGHDNNTYESPKITMTIAKAEGWLAKSGSKWKTMPELMIRYRAAAFFGRLYCPELLLGMQTEDEVIDVVAPIAEPSKEELQELYNQKSELIPEDQKVHIDRILQNEEKLSYKKVLQILNQY